MYLPGQHGLNGHLVIALAETGKDFVSEDVLATLLLARDRVLIEKLALFNRVQGM